MSGSILTTINDWGRLTYSKELTDDEVAEHLNNIEIQLEYSLAMQLQIFSRDESNEVQEFIDVGESGLALEILMAIIFEETKEISSEALSLIQQLDGKMRMNTGIKHIEKYDGVPLGLKKLINDHLITKDASPDTEHVSYPCVHFMLSYQEKKLQDELKDSDLRLIQYDIAAVNDKASLLQSVSEALELPDYFGHNWDALDECLVDMNDWMPAKGYVLVLSDAGVTIP